MSDINTTKSKIKMLIQQFLFALKRFRVMPNALLYIPSKALTYIIWARFCLVGNFKITDIYNLLNKY